MKMTFKLLSILLLLSIAQPVFSHGTVIYPASRIYNCYNNPSTATCGPCGNAIYDWMGVLQPHTNFGDHQAFVPDGQIASGGNGSGVDFSCLDALTADWPATTVNHGYVDVLWENTAPHKTQYYKVYITPLNWDPTKPLLWNELIEIGHLGKGPAQSFTTVRSFIPDSYAGKRAALVSVWQRDYDDSHEAFYAVSDILVAGTTGCTIGDSVNITFANNTNCTLAYYQNNTLQGSANSGSSYTTNTTVGSHWEIRDNTGNQADTLTIACDQSTYTSTGQCNGNGCATGDSVSITFANNTDCTLTYYQNNTLQGSANAGGSYIANTTIGSHWDVREPSGEQASHFHIACGQTTYTSTGNCKTNTGCSGLDTWSANATYVSGNKVAYNGVEYEAKWWNQGENPEQNSNPYDVWKNLGPCSSNGCTTGDTASVIFENDTDCTLTYYQNNTLQGSANAGDSYATSTTIGSHWEARKASGEQVSQFHIACDQTTYSSTGGCNNNTGGCAPAYSPYPIVYMTGDVISHNARNYECLVDNLFNVTPGTAPHWWKDLGPCATSSNARISKKGKLVGELNFVVFPNPAKDIINLEIINPQSSSYTIAITGIDGRILETIMLNAPEGLVKVNKSIELHKLSPGIYFINVTSGKKTLTQKFIVN